MVLGDDDIEIIDIAAVMFVTEVHGDEAIKRVEIDIGEELRSEVADDHTLTWWLEEKAFVFGEATPIFVGALDFDTIYGVVENDFVDGVF